MAELPFAFCESVIAALRKPSHIRQTFRSRVWQTAIDEHVEHRCLINVDISYKNGVWYDYISYSHFGDVLNVEDLQKVNRKYLRIARINLDNSDHGRKSSFEEILRIVKFTLAYVSMSTLSIHCIDFFPQEHLNQLLFEYRNSSFSSLYTLGNIDPIGDALKGHLAYNTLSDVRLCAANMPGSLEYAIQEFIVLKPFELIQLEPLNWKLDRAFFERLFAKQFDGFVTICSVICCFSFQLNDLKEFRKELQVKQESWIIQWKREDGVRVEISKYGSSSDILEINFSNSDREYLFELVPILR